MPGKALHVGAVSGLLGWLVAPPPPETHAHSSLMPPHIHGTYSTLMPPFTPPARTSTGFGCRNVNATTSGAAPADPLGPVGLAVGSRAHLEQEAVAQRSKLRNFLMHGFHMLVTFVAGGAVKDTQCGFKVCGESEGVGQGAGRAGRLQGREVAEQGCSGVGPPCTALAIRVLALPPLPPSSHTHSTHPLPQLFTRRAAATLYGNQRLQRWCFDVELLLLAQRLGVPVAEVQVRGSLGGASAPLRAMAVAWLRHHVPYTGMLPVCTSQGRSTCSPACGSIRAPRTLHCPLPAHAYATPRVLPLAAVGIVVAPLPPLSFTHIQWGQLLWCYNHPFLSNMLCPRAQVNWTEMPGSKIRFTSILHMAFELATLKVRARGGVARGC